jgi:sulfatase modifying factor 1
VGSTTSMTGMIRRIRVDSNHTVEDAELLDRYARGHDQAAFATLVERYGCLVLGVARRYLADRQQSEDVFQATFLALARAASHLGPRAILANWLYTVALRQARKTRGREQRQGSLERTIVRRSDTSPDPLDEITGRELLQMIDEEIALLPDRFRLPVLLCCVQGLSREEAARRLGWSVGTVKGRLERGRGRLAARLMARGLSPSILIAPFASIAIPAELLARTAAIAAEPFSEHVPLVIANLAAAGLVRRALPLTAFVSCILSASVAGLILNSGGKDPLVSTTPPASVPNHALKAVAEAEPKAGEEREFEIVDGVKMKFCWIPSGEAQLGSPKTERDAVLKQLIEAKKVTDGKAPKWLSEESDEVRGKFKTKGFWLGKYLVTQSEWKAVMGDNPSFYDGKKQNKLRGMDTSRFPVEWVSWDDCQKFLEKLNKRDGLEKVFGKAGKFVLPHEDQWEYACRGGKGNKQAFYFGNELNGTQANCNGTNAASIPPGAPFGTDKNGDFKWRTTEVGSYAKDWPHPWSLCDMHGNLRQWCDNKYEHTSERMLRGGSYTDDARDCRSASRFRFVPVAGDDHDGFRVCLSLETDNPNVKAVLEKAGKTADQIADPANRAYALMYVAIAQSKAGDRAGAAITFEQSILAAEAIQHGDGSIKGQALMFIVKAQAETGHMDAALETASRIQTKGGNSKEWALAHVASAQARAKHVKEAMETVERIPDDGKSFALMLISGGQAEAGDLKGALKTAEQISNGLNKVEAFTIVAQAQAKAGEVKAAEKNLEKAMVTAEKLEDGNINLDTSQKAHALTLIAAVQAQIGDLEKPLIIAERLKGSFKEQEVLASVAKALIQAGKLPDAMKYVDKLKDGGLKGSVLLDVVKAHVAKNDINAARKAIEAIELDYRKCQPLLELSKALAKAGDHTGAKTACREAVNNLKNYDTVWYANGGMSAGPDYLHQIMTVRAEIGDQNGAITWANEQESPFITTLVLAAVAEGLVKRKERELGGVDRK